jgi:hypothetical protein
MRNVTRPARVRQAAQQRKNRTGQEREEKQVRSGGAGGYRWLARTQQPDLAASGRVEDRRRIPYRVALL